IALTPIITSSPIPRHHPTLQIILHILLPPPTSTLFPYTTLFRSAPGNRRHAHGRNDRGRPPGDSSQQRWRRMEQREEVHRELSQIRKSTRLNSSHDQISYAVFCLKKKKNLKMTPTDTRTSVYTGT